MKLFKTLIKVTLALSLLVAGCSRVSPAVKDRCLTNKPNMREFSEIVSTQSREKTLYVFFVSNEGCQDCIGFREKVQEIDPHGNILYLDIELTWVFLTSRSLGVTNIPAMIVFIDEKPEFGRTGSQKILEYLHGNQK